jgi:hypothetical protein
MSSYLGNVLSGDQIKLRQAAKQPTDDVVSKHSSASHFTRASSGRADDREDQLVTIPDGRKATLPPPAPDFPVLDWARTF